MIIRLHGRTLTSAITPDPLAADRHASAEHARRSPHHSGSRRPAGHARGLGPEETEEENAGCGDILAPSWCIDSLTPLNWLGFARRYFTLYESGVLSYAFHPGEPVRDQISLGQAAISNEPC